MLVLSVGAVLHSQFFCMRFFSKGPVLRFWFCFWVKDLHRGSCGSRSARAARMLDSASSRRSGAATPGAPGRLTSEVGFPRRESLGQERCTGGPRRLARARASRERFFASAVFGKEQTLFRSINSVPLPCTGPSTVAADGGHRYVFSTDMTGETCSRCIRITCETRTG